MPNFRPLLAALLTLLFAAPVGAAEGDAEPSVEVEEAPAPKAPRKITGRNCLGQPQPAAVMRSLFGIKYGEWGLEERLSVGACVPLWKDKGILFDLSAFEAGFLLHATPIYAMPGAYMTFAPLSILSFMVEGAPIFYWPINVSSAGYYPIASYDSDFSKAALPAEDGGTALGWYVRFGANLQLAVPIGPIRLIVVDSVRFEHFSIGDQPFYFHNRNDLPAARNDWFVDNTAIVLAELRPHVNVRVRLGVNDQLIMNLGGNKISNAVRGVMMINFEKVGPRIRDFMPILAVGGRTHHPIRQGDFNFIVALSFAVDLSRTVDPSERKGKRSKKTADFVMPPLPFAG